jgi:holliday junction DNA helicase RuvB
MSDPTIPTGERVRATRWSDFVGQKNLQRRLQTHIMAAIEEKRPLDHMLLAGPPGVGKTTLARLLALAMGQEFVELVMPIKPKEFIAMVETWKGGVMLLDEIHRAPKSFQETLLSIEQGFIQTDTGEKIPTRHITFICATTEPQLVIPPLWDRLLIKPMWEDYADDEMAQIIVGMGTRAGIEISEDLAHGLGRATAGTPRIAGSLVVAARDLGVTGQAVTVESVLELAGVDCDGLSERHLQYLWVLRELGRRSGLVNIRNMMQLAGPVVEGLERLLIKRGLIRLESNGRVITPQGLAKLPPREHMSMADRQKAS